MPHAHRNWIVSTTILTLVGGLATAQPFAEGSGAGSEDMVGPQDLPGRPKRVDTPATTAGEPASEAAAAAEETPQKWWGWERATGDWWGGRTRMEDGGLTIEGSYTGEWTGVWDGGVRRHPTVRGLLDINATLDLEKVLGWQSASLFADFYWIDGNSVSADAGDIQGVSNIEGDDRFQIAEVWYQQSFFEGKLRAKVGKIEANSEFAFVNAAGDFINSSAGFTPTLIALPSYPDPATGLVLSWTPDERFSLTGGFMDGAATVDGVRTGSGGPATFFSDDRSGDYFVIAEANLNWDGGRAGFGVWHHTGDFAEFSGGESSGTTAFYALAEHRVWKADDERGIDLFAQFGWADDEVSDVEWHLGLGAAWQGVCESRPSDATGVYVSFAALSDPAGYADDETVVEWFYKVQLTGSVSVKPDIQFVFSPSGDSSLDDAVVGGLRVEIAF
jgi:porin